MKNVFAIITVCLMTVTMASAQTQQKGIVKTRGRMVNGQHVKGQGLPGATVTIQGGNNYIVQNSNGAFSFPIPAKTFTVSSVQKKGYQLVDADALKKAYQYSQNPLYLVMETPEQQMEDLLDAQERISKTLRKQLNNARAEIQRLKDVGKITEEEYRQRIAKLMEDQKNNQKLIADMAEEYAQIDYDQMDSQNQRISDAILNGRLTEADSLLRSKGDMRSRNEEIDRRLQAEAQRKNEIAREQDELTASEEGTRKMLEDFAADCYKYFDMYRMENRHDSAVYYIELRASRDTTNAEWQFDAGYYLLKQNQHIKAITYYEKALNIYRRLTVVNPQVYEPAVAMTLNNLAYLYKDTQRFGESEVMYKEALETFRRLSIDNPQTYESDLAVTLNNLAILYASTQRFGESEAMYKGALEIFRRLANTNQQAYEPNVAATLHNLANLYYSAQRFGESEAMYKETLEIYRRLANVASQTYEPDLATSLNNMAVLYMDTQRYDESEMMNKEALIIRRRLADANPLAYEPDLAMTLNNLAILYANAQRFDESEMMYKEALEIRRRLADTNPQAYEPDVAATLNNLAALYAATQRFDESEIMYKEALEIFRRLADANPLVYESAVAQTQYVIGWLKEDQNQYEEAIPAFEEALEIYRRLAKKNPTQQQWYEYSLYRLSQLYTATNNKSAAYHINQEWLPILKNKYTDNPNDWSMDYSAALGSQSFSAIFMKLYAEAEQLAREGLTVDSTQHWIASNLASSLLFQGKYAEAEQVYRQYKEELKEGFLDDFQQFAEAGVIPKESEADVEKIKKILLE